MTRFNFSPDAICEVCDFSNPSRHRAIEQGRRYEVRLAEHRCYEVHTLCRYHRIWVRRWHGPEFTITPLDVHEQWPAEAEAAPRPTDFL